MFRDISRRLAILNALVVIAVIAAVGLSTYFFLARKIETQVDSELRNRSSSAVQLWTNVYLSAAELTPEPTSGSSGSSDEPAEDAESQDQDGHESDDHDDDNEHEAEELVRSGDTIAYGLDLSGKVISSLRPIDIEGLPKQDSVQRALNGSIVVETVNIEESRVRLRTEPVLTDGRIVGAVQVGMGLGPSEQILTFVRWATIGGLLLGMLLAVPSGWWLASRSMRPISEAFDRQRSFVSDASHELRTPLTMIRAEAEYLQQTPNLTPEEQKEGETAIIREVDSMASLVSNLLQLTRFDEHQVQLERGIVDLSDVARSVAERYRNLAEDRGVALAVEAGQPVAAMANRAAADQALSILVDNAISYTPSGGSVTLGTQQRSDGAAIAVQDTGIGISSADQKRVFDRFYRADPARTRAAGGVGLGLSIASELMKAQQGRIQLESEPGHGSTFTLLFGAAPRSGDPGSIGGK